VASPEDAEAAAQALRDKWRLGLDPISDLTMVLEDHLVHVIEIKSCEKFDGLSAIVRNSAGKPVATGVASRDDVSGDRQRLSLAHELAHLVMKVADGSDEEKLAFRFAAAFLLPEPCVRREIGKYRTTLEVSELILMKKRFKVSIQAIVRRLYDLNIISHSTYTSAFTTISQLGWKKVEPELIPREKSEWSRQIGSRGLAEKLLTLEETERLTGLKFEHSLSTSLVRRIQFRSLPMAERRRLLALEAAKLSDEYAKPSDWQSLDAEPFHEQ
jgi:Zn-dependent peptidase ImmA (M78 family)